MDVDTVLTFARRTKLNLTQHRNALSEACDWLRTYAFDPVKTVSRQDAKTLKHHLTARSVETHALSRSIITDTIAILLFYLQDECDFTIPSHFKKRYKNLQNERVMTLGHFERIASTFAASVHERAVMVLAGKAEVSAELLMLVLWVDTAPLPLANLTEVVNGPQTREPTLPATVLLQGGHLRNEQCARYLLGPLSAKLLEIYRQAPQTTVLNERLKRDLCNLANALIGEAFFERASQIERCAIQHWVNSHGFWAALQLNQPHNQCALPLARYRRLNEPTPTLANTIGQCQAFSPRVTQRPTNAETLRATRTGFEQTLKRFANHQIDKDEAVAQLAPERSEMDEENILNYLLGHYAVKLLTEGGSKKTVLRTSTIREYLSLATVLNQWPLPFSEALESDGCYAWGKRVIREIPENHLAHLFRFFKFLPSLLLFDHFPANDLIYPLAPSKVDANTVSPAEHQLLIESLYLQNGERQQTTHTHIAASLAYHGMLRRGEILRLRLGDVTVCPKTKEILALNITNTDEGKTKNGRSRWVHVCLDRESNDLLLGLLAEKSPLPKDAPLFGIPGQTLSARARYLLAPISLLLKAVCGDPTIRFHHLRHGGAQVYFFQLMKFVYPWAQIPPSFARHTDRFDEKHVKRRVSRWCVDTPRASFNVAIVLDQLTLEIGHDNIATTRKHYLHGSEWLLDVCRHLPLKYAPATINALFNNRLSSKDGYRRQRQLATFDMSVMGANVNNEAPATQSVFHLARASQTTTFDRYQPRDNTSLTYPVGAHTRPAHPFDAWANLAHARLSEPVFESDPRLPFIVQSKKALEHIYQLPNWLQQAPWPSKRQQRAWRALLPHTVFVDIEENTLRIAIEPNRQYATRCHTALSWLGALKASVDIEIAPNRRTSPDNCLHFAETALNLKKTHIKVKKPHERGRTQCTLLISPTCSVQDLLAFIEFSIR
ncbi:hypothetical protein [Thalassotalea litorea]|uniref:hypothetical protein n=1 Tax=Thalassotalea litorea TaxID=2020715 RepID=UPI0037352ACE